MPPTHAAIIYTDGACLGNPGPAGAGFVISDQKGVTLKEGCVPIGHGTNNVAEYQGVISALEAAAEMGLTHLLIRSDSELLCKQMSGQYRVKNPGLKRLHVQVRRLVERFEKVTFQHVRREKNEQADALAGKAAKRAASGAPSGPEGR